jgi:hypothetical protein
MAKELFTAEWFPYYFDRFNASGRVAKLSLAEEGAYHRAIRFAWEHGAVPSDPEEFAAIIQKQCTVEIAEKLLKLFEPMHGVPSKCIHPTVEEIRREQYERYLSAAERGKKGSDARWGKKDETGAVSIPARLHAKRAHSPAAQTSKDACRSSRDDDPPKNGSAMAELKQYRDKREESKDSDPDSFSETDSCVRACVRAFPAVDAKLVEIAVIKTLIQHRQSPTARPIRSTRYFREEIEDMAFQATRAEVRLGETAINAMLHSYRQKAEKYLTAAAGV